jgi:hypothetical protein
VLTQCNFETVDCTKVVASRAWCAACHDIRYVNNKRGDIESNTDLRFGQAAAVTPEQHHSIDREIGPDPWVAQVKS